MITDFICYTLVQRKMELAMNRPQNEPIRILKKKLRLGEASTFLCLTECPCLTPLVSRYHYTQKSLRQSLWHT